MIDIFYKSYRNDFNWLYFSLESIKKFVTGYNRIVIVIPERDRQLIDFNRILPSTDVHFIDERTRDINDGYLYQQWVKMTAHNYCKSEYIMYADSDIVFNRHVNVKDLVTDGKPTIYYTPYDKVGPGICWKEPTDRFMNAPQDYEFMRRLPLTYHRSTIQTIASLEPRLYNIIMDSGRFSEFNAIGAWAFANERHKYNFINTEEFPPPENFIVQFWSRSGLDQKDLSEITKILR